MKCLLLTKFGRRGATSRIRSLQYIPYLDAQGISITHHSLLDDDFLRRVYEGRRPDLIDLGLSVFQRVKFLLRASSFDLLWIEKEVFPFMPPWAEDWLVRRGIPYIVDYDAAAFHRYESHPDSRVRRFLGNKIDHVMQKASLVVVANDYLAGHAKSAGARRVEIVPSAIDLHRYPLNGIWGNGRYTVGWVGTPKTQTYLTRVADALKQIEDLRFIALGARDINLPGVTVHLEPWVESTEAHEIGKFDVGIMPLPDTEWERGKSGYKLIQYMACGRPVVASPVGVNKDLVEEGRTGFLASSDSEWVDALREFKENAHLRKEMGVRGRRVVEERYSTRVVGPRLAELLRSAA